MFSQSQKNLIIFVISVVLLLVLFGVFIVTIIYKYQKKQISYFKEIEELKITHENTLLQSQLEIQEQTFQNIAREIHDNIGQKLTLAKLYLNTIFFDDLVKTKNAVESSLDLITESISSLSDVSRSMSTDLILENGLVKGIEMEVANIKKTGVFEVDFHIAGREVFLPGKVELVIFRIVQECINNFLKHAGGSKIVICLQYQPESIRLSIHDNGKGFNQSEQGHGAGLLNIKKRAALLNGVCEISSNFKGSSIIVNIPTNESTYKTPADIGG